MFAMLSLAGKAETLYDSRGSKISKGSVLASSSHQSTKGGTAFSDSLLELGERHNEVSQGDELLMFTLQVSVFSILMPRHDGNQIQGTISCSLFPTNPKLPN